MSPSTAEVWAVTMVRNEEDVIVPVIEHLIGEGIDGVIVADNLSTDSTPVLLADLAERLPVLVIQDREPAYLQSTKMTRLARMAAERGAAWIIPFDADEIWRSPNGPLADVLRASVDADVLLAGWITHYPLPWRGGTPFDRMCLRDRRPSVHHHKVAFRALPEVVVQQGNHDVVGRAGLRRQDGRLVVHHYRYRSFRHMLAKTRAGKAAVEQAGDALAPSQSNHWRRIGGYPVWRAFVSWVYMYWAALKEGVTFERVPLSRP